MPLSNNEKYIVQGMFSDGIELENIAKSLDKTPRVVKNYIDQWQNSLKKIEENKRAEEAKLKEAKPKKPKKKAPKYDTAKPKAGDLMGLRTAKKGNSGVAVMTEAAAFCGDDFTKGTLPDLSGRLHTIKEKNG